MLDKTTPPGTRLTISWVESTLEDLRGLLSPECLDYNNDTVLEKCLKDNDMKIGETYTLDRMVPEPKSIHGYGVRLVERPGCFAPEHFSAL